jgi:hypothetical protein
MAFTFFSQKITADQAEQKINWIPEQRHIGLSAFQKVENPPGNLQQQRT